jgi:hypothetical protein
MAVHYIKLYLIILIFYKIKLTINHEIIDIEELIIN